MNKLHAYLVEAGRLAQLLGASTIGVPHLLMVVANATNSQELLGVGIASEALTNYMYQHGQDGMSETLVVDPELNRLIGQLEGALIFGAIEEVDDAAIIRVLIEARSTKRIAELLTN